MSTYTLLMQLLLKQFENISAKTSMALKLRICSPVNLSPSTIYNTIMWYQLVAHVALSLPVFRACACTL